MSLLFVASFASIANGQGSRLGAEAGTRPAAIEPAEAKALLGKPLGIATILIPLGNISVEEPPRIHVTESTKGFFIQVSVMNPCPFDSTFSKKIGAVVLARFGTSFAKRFKAAATR